ncbi:hypothetical protein K3495_g13037 [Podosphaera aphanis]|nr:hypothetical protein K3495_g13037 [Podosphaera aphanis]
MPATPTLSFKEILDQVETLSKISQDRYEKNANMHRSDAPNFQIGNMVMVSNENRKMGRPVDKLNVKVGLVSIT